MISVNTTKAENIRVNTVPDNKVDSKNSAISKSSSKEKSLTNKIPVSADDLLEKPQVSQDLTPSEITEKQSATAQKNVKKVEIEDLEPNETIPEEKNFDLGSDLVVEVGEHNNVEKIAEGQTTKPETENDGCNCTGKVQTQNIEDDKSENDENIPKSPLQLANEKLSCKAMCTKEKIIRGLQVTFFYLLYFCFLGGLGVASVLIFLTMVSPDTPYRSTLIQIPGVNNFPKVSTRGADKKRYKAYDDVYYSWYTGDESSWGLYSDRVDNEREKYGEKKDIVYNNYVKVFKWDSLGTCSEAPYGWNSDSPCIFLRLNKIIDWLPIGYLSPPENTFYAEDGPRNTIERDAIYFRCKSFKPDDWKEAKDGNYSGISFEYFGGDQDRKAKLDDGFITRQFFPYKGSRKHPGYQPPVVAVKLIGLQENMEHKVQCRAFASNIPHNTVSSQGMVTFNVKYLGERVTESSSEGSTDK